MRVFVLAVVAAAALATVAAFSLNTVQLSAAQNLTTGSARLDQQEAVNRIGREG